jgi:GNAT superfamily N-acetyltransferase
MTPDTARLLAMYEQHMRRESWIPGMVRHTQADVSRYLSQDGRRGFVMWHRFDAALSGPALRQRVQDELDWFKAQGAAADLMLYWKVYGGDSPAGLQQLLVEMGAQIEDESLLHMVPVARVLAATKHSAVVVHASVLSADLPLTLGVWDEVWPEAAEYHLSWQRVYAQALDEYAAAHTLPGVCFFNACVAGKAEPQAASYIILPPGSPVALLCGGAVRPGARGQGLYSAMLRERAQWAQQRGATHLAIEASPMSQPIVQRLGFEPLVSMAFYMWALR